MKPSYFGFSPTKFPSYRPGQAELALEIAHSPNRFELMSVPPGGGKSLLYMTVARAMSMLEDRPIRALVLVGTKGLQQQIAHDAFSAYDIYGHANYPCLHEDADPDTTCDVGPCRLGEECDLRDEGCPSYDARRAAARSRVVVANYSLWMALGRYGDDQALGKFDLLVLDEAHTARDWLAKFCSVELVHSELRPYGVDPPPVGAIQTPIMATQCAPWARSALAKVRAVRQIHQRLGSRAAREAMKRQQLEQDLQMLSGLDLPDAGQWVVEVTTSRAGHMTRFSPVWAGQFAERFIFRGVPKIVLSSATLSPLDRKYLAIPETASAYHERPSIFPPARRPFYYVPAAAVSHKMSEGEVRLWVSVIDRILDSRLDRKGIIHTRSYDRARQILERSRHADLMISHTNSAGLRAAVAAFKDSAAPRILVSPSVEEGFDFPDHECRFQIIAKLPFLDMSDAVTRARMKSDKGYSLLVTAQTILQMYGRGVRSAEDWAECFVVDDNWDRWFVPACLKLGVFPGWFRAAWRRVGSVPPPLDPG